MPRSTDRILTTHAGSLPRPDDLVQLMWDKLDGKPVDSAALDARIRSAVVEVVQKQRAAGIDLVSDGEMSKPGFSNYVCERFAGFGGQSEFQADDVADFPELALKLFANPGGAHIILPNLEGPLERRDPEAVRKEIANFTAALGDGKPADAFLCAATPGQIAFNFPNKYYPSHEAYLEAAATAMREEYQAITDAGFLLQLDSPDLAMAAHTRTVGSDVPNFQAHLELAIEALNHAVAGIPPEQMRLHVCWGNYGGPHHKDVPLKDVLPPVLKARCQAISFEAANPRHEHEWEVFEEVKLPADKVLIPGVIDTKTNHIEHPRLVAQRLVRFAQLVGRENVIAGTDCGFGTFVGWSAVDARVAWAKLQVLAEGAKMASRELWGR